MKDTLSVFRECMQLERRRSAGLSPLELERLLRLRKRLEKVFGGLEGSRPGERRATPRVRTLLEVRFDDDAEIGRVLMTNLSRGGIFVPTEVPLPIGTEIKLRIRIEASSTEVALLGEVVSCNVGPRLDAEQRGMGIRFKKLSEGDQKIVDDLYERVVVRHLAGG